LQKTPPASKVPPTKARDSARVTSIKIENTFPEVSYAPDFFKIVKNLFLENIIKHN
jgi:hypothetical protein